MTDRAPRSRRSTPRLKTALPRRDRRRRCATSSSYANVMQVPGLTKIVVNMGVGEAARDSKLIEGAIKRPDRRSPARSRGDQGPQVHRPVQAARGHADRRPRHAAGRPDVGVPRPAALARAAPDPRLPWPSPQQFDGNGNYTFGLTEQVMFHEIDQDTIDRLRGMDITVVTTATNDDEGRALLRQLGFPFKEN